MHFNGGYTPYRSTHRHQDTLHRNVCSSIVHNIHRPGVIQMAITLETTHTLLTHSHIRTLYSSENELKLYIKHYG